jgi:hypothetical protein
VKRLARLVRPHSYVLALGFGLVVSEVCIPLDHKVLAHIAFVPGGFLVL